MILNGLSIEPPLDFENISARPPYKFHKTQVKTPLNPQRRLPISSP
jgi:hypothetical protein